MVLVTFFYFEIRCNILVINCLKKRRKRMMTALQLSKIDVSSNNVKNKKKKKIVPLFVVPFRTP